MKSYVLDPQPAPPKMLDLFSRLFRLSDRLIFRGASMSDLQIAHGPLRQRSSFARMQKTEPDFLNFLTEFSLQKKLRS